jgi:regulation of enolase protein 1 (concanavalin A-like superfamily)
MLVVILHYSAAKCEHWGKLGIEYTDTLIYFSYQLSQNYKFDVFKNHPNSSHHIKNNITKLGMVGHTCGNTEFGS